MEDGGEGVGPQDEAGLTIVAGDDPDATQEVPVQRPDAPSDPEWGKTSFRPQLSSVARRASLFDLPDPSEGENDPFDTGAGAPTAQAPVERTGEDPLAPAPAQDVPEPISTISAADLEEARPKKAGILDRLRGLARRKGSSDADSADDDAWRGGAATRSGLRLVDGDDVPAEDELRDAVLKLGDDALIAHDIWFVALGGSSLGHAGMRSFLARHRSEVRGCFVVNLDCVGAGALTALKSEGLELTRRGDRTDSTASSPALPPIFTPSSRSRLTTGPTPTRPPRCAPRCAASPSWASTPTAFPRSPRPPMTWPTT